MGYVDLTKHYPKSDRSGLLAERAAVKLEDRQIARQFGEEYFDGPRHLGLGGYRYDPKYWSGVVEDMIDYYGLHNGSKILDVGCGKGFMLYDFKKALPGAVCAGLDVSEYCLKNRMPGPLALRLGDCELLPYEDKTFDLVVSIATIHNQDLPGVKRSLQEIMRVSKRDAFIKVNAYRNEDEREALEQWNLVAKTILSVPMWTAMFEEVGYTGDYCWFTP